VTWICLKQRGCICLIGLFGFCIWEGRFIATILWYTLYFIKHYESSIKSSMLFGSPAQFPLHSCNTGKRSVVPFYLSYCPPLDHFHLVNICLGVRVPDSRWVRYLGPDQGLVYASSLTFLLWVVMFLLIKPTDLLPVYIWVLSLNQSPGFICI
jgi:hypothetical protein